MALRRKIVSRKIANFALGSLITLNLVVFGMFAGVKSLSASASIFWVDCVAQYCDCVGPGGGLPDICMMDSVPPERPCRFFDDCDPH